MHYRIKRDTYSCQFHFSYPIIFYLSVFQISLIHQISLCQAIMNSLRNLNDDVFSFSSFPCGGLVTIYPCAFFLVLIINLTILLYSIWKALECQQNHFHLYLSSFIAYLLLFF